MIEAAGGRTLRFLQEKSVTELRAVKPRKVAGLASMGIESVLDLLMHYPRRYDRPPPPVRDRGPRRRRGGDGHRNRAPRLGSPHERRQDDGAAASSTTGRPASKWCSSTSPGGPARLRRGRRGRHLRPHRDVPGRTADDQSGHRPRRRPDRPHRAGVPPVGQGQDRFDRDRLLRYRGARAHQDGWARSCRRDSSTSSTSSAARRPSAGSTPPRASTSGISPGAAWLSTSCCDSS